MGNSVANCCGGMQEQGNLDAYNPPLHEDSHNLPSDRFRGAAPEQ